MRFLSLFLIVASASAGDSAAPVGAAAVWNPPSGFLAAMHAACDARPERLSECFPERMRAAGASPEAVAFTERAGGLQYLRAFREAGRVDVAWAVNPFRANTNDLVDLVNGDPPILDVDDPKYFEPAMLERHPGYAAMRRAHPKLAPFPGDRYHRHAVQRMAQVGGGQRFVVGEDLRDGCHACAILGEARVAFDFDAAGKFRGIQVLMVRAMPAPQP
ncbi:MAG TPA: hypothetical protein VMQ61_16900 [Thermoanaerobaculia bacterium]|nr:hypothetical protein [Thermoanaerobaculia bacterium]